ncbi:MAG: DUF3662 domain-containing protein [Propionibacteriaceae bacterium]|jgi:hypothetical protein|nr:DUF3662 domain-containing protein [Propionibacteriaceae bacterium]
MGIFSSAEKKLDGAIAGIFTRVFKGDVQPVEITNAICRELDNQAQILSAEKRLVPNEFLISLSPSDYARFVPYSKTLTAEITADVRDYATDRSYIFNGPILIQFDERPDLPVGRLEVAASTVADVREAHPGIATGSAQLVLEVNGVRHPLTAPGFTVGRSDQADLRINDPGISRIHARFEVTGSGPDTQVKIVDLHSTNGLMVDGRKTTAAAIGDGSRINIGKTQMLVYAPAGQ